MFLVLSTVPLPCVSSLPFPDIQASWKGRRVSGKDVGVLGGVCYALLLCRVGIPKNEGNVFCARTERSYGNKGA